MEKQEISVVDLSEIKLRIAQMIKGRVEILERLKEEGRLESPYFNQFYWESRGMFTVLEMIDKEDY